MSKPTDATPTVDKPTEGKGEGTQTDQISTQMKEISAIKTELIAVKEQFLTSSKKNEELIATEVKKELAKQAKEKEEVAKAAAAAAEKERSTLPMKKEECTKIKEVEKKEKKEEKKKVNDQDDDFIKFYKRIHEYSIQNITIVIIAMIMIFQGIFFNSGYGMNQTVVTTTTTVIPNNQYMSGIGLYFPCFLIFVLYGFYTDEKEKESRRHLMEDKKDDKKKE